jgi:hypothetical protein
MHWRGSHEESVQKDQQQKKHETPRRQTQRGKVEVEGQGKDQGKGRKQGQAVAGESEEGQSCVQGIEQGEAAR